MAKTDVDWSVSLGPVSGPVAAATAAFMTTAATRALDWPTWLPMVTGVVTSIVVWTLCRAWQVHDRITLFGVGCCAVAAAWSTWVVFAGWSAVAILVLAGATGTAGLLGPALLAMPVPEQDVIGVGGMTRLEESWAALISKIATGKEPVTVRKIRDWPKDSGYTLEVEFAPGSGHTWDVLASAVNQLGGARRLPQGCQVTAEPSPAHQGAARLHVPVINRLADLIPFPTHAGPIRLVDGFPIGEFGSGEETNVEIHQSSGIVAGRRGGGKTVILHVMTAWTKWCEDAVVWHADLNGGGMSAPWMLPYATGKVDRPPIDWAATCPDDALEMAEAGLRIAKDRKARYQRLMIEKNTDILPISEHLPAIVIIVDEGGEIFGEDAQKTAKAAAKKFAELQRIGRAMCVNVLLSSQRGTATYLTSDVKKAVGLMICTMVKDDSELASVFDWEKGLSAANLTKPGMAYIVSDRYPSVRMYKGYGILPAQIQQIAFATDKLCVQLDPAAIAAAGIPYRNRLNTEGMRRFLAGLRGEETDVAIPDGGGSSVGGAIGALGTAVAELRRAKQGDVEPEAQPGQDSGQDPMSDLEELEAIASLPVFDPDAVDIHKSAESVRADDVDARRATVLDIVRAAGTDGIRTGDVVAQVQAAGIAVRREAVGRWLRDLEKDGMVGNPRQGLWIAT